jgi:hypothetical protein
LRPDDLLAEGPRQVVDLARLIAAQARRRAALGELAPAPGLAGAGSLQLAIDPAAFGVSGNQGSTSLVLVDVTDEALAPDISAGDRVVVRLDPHRSDDTALTWSAWPRWRCRRPRRPCPNRSSSQPAAPSGVPSTRLTRSASSAPMSCAPPVPAST